MAVSTSRAVARRPSSRERSYRRLDHLVQSDPQRAIVEAAALVQSTADTGLVVHGWTTVGRALYELGDMHRAADAMRHALHSIDAVPHDDRLIRVRLSAAAVFAESGGLADALQQLDAAELVAQGATLGRVRTQRALILCQAGRLVEALQQANLAEADLRRHGDQLGLLRLIANRSLINLQRGDLVAAEVELLKARRLAQRLDQAISAALMLANLGVLHGRAGRTHIALQHFDRARQEYVVAGKPLRTMTILETDRAETLLRAGLFADAVAAGRLAAAHAHASGNRVSIGDAELVLARAQLASGDWAGAQRSGAAASQILHQGGRTAMSLQARAVALQAALESVVDDVAARSLLGRARRLAARLDRYGWSEMGDDLRCARLRCASRVGLMALVADDLATLRETKQARHAGVSVRGWFAEALARWHSGDSPGAMQAVRRGMTVLERYRHSTTEFEHRVGLSAIGADLAALGMQVAIESGSPGTVFVWAERTRANAFPLRAMTPGRTARQPTLAAVARTSTAPVLVEYVISNGRVFAVVAGRGRARLVDLGALIEVRKLADQLRVWLLRAAPADGVGAIDHAVMLAGRLDEILCRPLGVGVDDDVVVVPDADLHDVPWACLPTLSVSNFVVNASAGIWLDSERRAAGFECRSAGLVIGPGVAGAAVERPAIVRLYPRATVLAGTRATVRRTTALFKTCDVVQLAAHGTFRSDHPLLSSLQLHDREMTVSDVAGVDVGSHLVVLSSCEGGAHGVSRGSEVLGWGLHLMSRGAASVVAPVAVVSDDVCAEFVVDLHRE